MTSSAHFSKNNVISALTLLLLLAGLILSVMSWLELCSSACAEGHKYRLFGFKFEPIGLLFFATASILYGLSFSNKKWLFPLSLLASAGLGAESYFLYLQKYVIGKWCPMCLAIFACVALLTILIFYQTYRLRSEPMKNYAPLLSACAFLILGLSVAAAGVAKEEPYSVLDGHDSVYFGNKDSNVSVYIFTDWFCPACRKVEPALDKQLPEIMKKARVVFVDTVIHENSLNYLPYNLSFMMKEKDKYLTLRQKLTKMAKSDNEPTEAKIEELAKTSGVKYHELPYAEVQQGIKYFEKLQKNYSIESTPAIVIVNTKTNKGKKLTTVEQIAEADIPALVEKLAK